jgi:hypothetical protein
MLKTASLQEELYLEDTVAESMLVERGDVLLMRPLLAHCSNRSQQGTQQHRRNLHFEFAASPNLPDNYEWHTFLPARKIGCAAD